MPVSNELPILIVEDDPDTRTIIRTILNAKGHKTVEAENGLIALNVLETLEVKLILLDIMMPELSGYDVIVRLRMRPKTQSTPVIMLTAKGEDEDVLSGYNQYQVDYYITKPFTPKTLINGVDLVLAKA
jgi:DNA-binding response OmpR family regulator